MLMDAAKARRGLHWMPHHDADETLRQTIDAVRSR
jgi:nucleoside-diphosphate-sugar epimerase